ncbi:MAG: glycosyl transferase [Bacteroidetes bacterium SW_9_63_38]|nr:MAG: glycosyl transferase [Bacteroidetes bacterium SW_9_63_38]
MPDSPLVSIIIPTLNEASVLPSTLATLQQQPEPFEILVVDGGSTDATTARARAAGATVIDAPRGRGPQLNGGAEHARADLLLFLHADTQLPPNGLTLVRSALTTTADAGIFRLSFDRDSLLLRFYAWCTGWNWIRLCFGDRGLFATRAAFEAVGGFPNWPLFEDLELAARLDDYSDFHFLDAAVTTSARRFEQHGMLRQQLRNLYLWGHYVAGTNPRRLAHLYQYSDAPTSSSSGTALLHADRD